MPTNMYTIPGGLFSQTMEYSRHQKEEMHAIQYVPDIKYENTVVDMMNQIPIKNELRPLEILETDENEFEIDKILNLQYPNIVNNSLERNPMYIPYFEEKIKVEISAEEYQIGAQDLVPNQSEQITSYDMMEDLLSTLEEHKHDKNRPVENINSRSEEKHIKYIPKSEHIDNSFCYKSSTVVRVKRRRTRNLRSSISYSAVENESSVSKHHTEKRFSCATCTKTFTQYIHYQKHKGMKACEKYICPYCRKIFLHSTKMKNHINTHTGKNAFICEYCLKMYSTKEVLNLHIRSHSGEKPFCCNHCTKGYLYKESLIAHIQTSHTEPHVTRESSNNDLFCCPICSKSLASRGSLYEHRRLHSDFKPFQCAQCNQSYHFKRYLRQHIQCSHSEEGKTYRCLECGTSFAKKSTLNRHLVTHSKLKAFSCNECDRSFTRAYTVTLHKRIVHGDRKSELMHFICEYCAKLLPSRAQLENHIRTHTTEKPFECNFCNKRLATKGNLKQHIKTHLPEKPLVCNFCDKGWNTKGNLKQHIETHLKNILY